MAAIRRQKGLVEKINSHGDGVYTLSIHIEDAPIPRFRPGQFLQLAIDPYDPSSFWPESRAFSIAGASREDSRMHLTYSVVGRFTRRMERTLIAGSPVWLKWPLGSFCIDRDHDCVLLAGGTGITAFTAFLETLDASHSPCVSILYGARKPALWVYESLVQEVTQRAPATRAWLFSEEPFDRSQSASDNPSARHAQGRIDLMPAWSSLADPKAAVYYLAGPPEMMRHFTEELASRGVAATHIRQDDWE